MLITGLPGIKTTSTATPRDIFLTHTGVEYLSKSLIIDGSESRDSGNTGNLDVLRAGLVVSKIESSGLYATTIIGTVGTAYTGGTTLNMSAAAATELSRRYGATGTNEFAIVGQTDSGGSDEDAIALMQFVSHSAINTSTGDVTITDLVNDYGTESLIIAGAAVGMVANAQLTNTFILSDQYGIKVTAEDNTTSVDVALAQPLIAGQLNTAKIIDYPDTNGQLANWFKGELNDGKDLKFSDDA